MLQILHRILVEPLCGVSPDLQGQALIPSMCTVRTVGRRAASASPSASQVRVEIGSSAVRAVSSHPLARAACSCFLFFGGGFKAPKENQRVGLGV